MIRLFRVFIPASILGLFISEILLTAACYVGGHLLLDWSSEYYFFFDNGIARTAIVIATIILAIYFLDMYSEVEVPSRLRLLQSFLLVLGVAFLSQALVGYINRSLIASRRQMLFGSAMAIVVLPTWRLIYSRIILNYPGRQSVLLLGNHRLLHDIARIVAVRPEFGMKVLGHLCNSEPAADDQLLGPRLGILKDVKEVAGRVKPSLLVVGLQERRGNLPVHELLDLRLAGARVEEVGTVYEHLFWRVPLETLHPSHLLFSHELGPNPFNVQLQKLYSFGIAAFGTLLTLPIMLVVAVLVKLTSPGPALFRQRRVGLNGKIFELYKFRSMRSDAETGTGAVWATKNDPRITPLGRWLRKLRLDELPQFFNVLRGDMAICGPRPERPEFVQSLSEQIPFYAQRHAVLPGITGWAQINHKYGDTMEDVVTKLEFDLYYLKNLSPPLDLYIIFNTAKVMLLQRGAQ